jgi:hypothetical protein
MVPSIGNFVVVERIATGIIGAGHVILIQFVEHFLRQRQGFPLVLPPPPDQLLFAYNEEE